MIVVIGLGLATAANARDRDPRAVEPGRPDLGGNALIEVVPPPRAPYTSDAHPESGP